MRLFITVSGKLFTTPKDYMTQESMVFWDVNILAPHISLVRSVFGEENRRVLIGDGYTSNFSEKIDECLEKIVYISKYIHPS